MGTVLRENLARARPGYARRSRAAIDTGSRDVNDPWPQGYRRGRGESAPLLDGSVLITVFGAAPAAGAWGPVKMRARRGK